MEKNIKITIESDYGTTIIKKIDVDSNIYEVFEAFKECVLALGYHPDLVNEILKNE